MTNESWLWGFDQFIEDITTRRGNGMNNYDLAVKIYTKSGQYAIYDAVNNGILKADAWRDCIPCEDRTPHFEGSCLVCGTLADIKEEL